MTLRELASYEQRKTSSKIFGGRLVPLASPQKAQQNVNIHDVKTDCLSMQESGEVEMVFEQEFGKESLRGVKTMGTDDRREKIQPEER